MFGRKKKKRAIVLRDARGEVIARTPTERFALPEETVVRLSVEFYNDPEPCEIHRAAVMNRALMEIEERLSDGQPVDVDAAFFGFFPKEARTVQLVEVAR